MPILWPDLPCQMLTQRLLAVCPEIIVEIPEPRLQHMATNPDLSCSGAQPLCRALAGRIAVDGDVEALQTLRSVYRKVVATGGISDGAATEASTDIGMAGDAGINCAARSDLQFFYGFGIFKPGDAYPVLASDGSDGRALRQAHIVSLTLVF